MERSKITLGWAATCTTMPERECTRILPLCSHTLQISNICSPWGLAMLQYKQLKSLTGWREYCGAPACFALHPPSGCMKTYCSVSGNVAGNTALPVQQHGSNIWTQTPFFSLHPRKWLAQKGVKRLRCAVSGCMFLALLLTIFSFVF